MFFHAKNYWLNIRLLIQYMAKTKETAINTLIKMFYNNLYVDLNSSCQFSYVTIVTQEVFTNSFIYNIVINLNHSFMKIFLQELVVIQTC